MGCFHDCKTDEYTKVLLIRLVLLMVYLTSGAGIFMLIEGNKEVNHHEVKKSLFHGLKVNTTARFNMTEREFLELVEMIRNATVPLATGITWSFMEAMTYVTHLLTTIGYGNITPVTSTGQIVTIFYGLFGIPLTILTLKAMAANYNNAMMRIITYTEKKWLKRNQVKNIQVKIIIFNVVMAMVYLFASAVQTNFVEQLTFTQSGYAWFITMTTVGFGDFIPERNDPHRLLIGLCLMSAVLDAVGSFVENTQYTGLLRCRGCFCFSCFEGRRIDGAGVEVDQNLETKDCWQMYIDASSQTGDDNAVENSKL